MKQKTNQYLNENFKNTKIVLYALILSIIISVFGFGLRIKTLNKEINLKDYQITVLIDEIGEVKEENLYLYNNILKNREFYSKNIDFLNKTLDEALSIKDKEQSSLKEKYNEAQSEFTKLLNEKEFAIEQLQNKNQLLTKEMEFHKYDDEIQDILILGINQGLTDTMIIASINPSKESITLISIPRDLYINGRKINSIYKIYGIDKIIRDIYSVTGINIDRYVILDFAAFEKMIDIIGGIDIYVHEDIYDSQFPLSNNGYTVYSINEGSHHMDGKEALMYARSRKSTSDFDRSKRQQQVIQAIRVKLKMKNLLSDLDMAKEIFSTIVQNLETNIDIFEALSYLKNYQNYVIESGNVLNTSNFLYASKTIDGQYILLPTRGDFYAIKQYISQLINN